MTAAANPALAKARRSIRKALIDYAAYRQRGVRHVRCTVKDQVETLEACEILLDYAEQVQREVTDLTASTQRAEQAERQLKAMDALLTHWMGQCEAAERRLDAARQRITDHYLWRVDCDHDAKTDVAHCSCGLWRSEALPSVGAAVAAWAEHALKSPAET